jgi:hypothetical protein
MPQNHHDSFFGLSVALLNQLRDDDMRHASRSGGLLRLEASHVRVSQSGLKTGKGMTAGGPSQRLR